MSRFVKSTLAIFAVCLHLFAQTCFSQNKLEWYVPAENVHTLFYQGMNNSQVQLAKYTGEYGFCATTGEHVTASKGVPLIYSPFIGKEIEEVRLGSASKITLNPWYFVQECCSKISNKSLGVKIYGNPKSDKTVAAHAVYLGKICIGQDNDIKSHKIKYDKYVKKHANEPLILYGVSRGTATTFNSIISNGYDVNNIKLVILEGAIDSIPHVLQERPILGKLPLWFINSVLSSLTSYNSKGPHPIDNIDRFPENIPVVLITSEIDEEVPAVCTKALAKAFIERGKNPVHLLILNKSRHPRYMMDDETDTTRYLAFIHSIYKKYNLPYIPHFAKIGEDLHILEQ